MRNYSFYVFLFCGLLYSNIKLLAQDLSPELQREVDSLRKELRIAKSDTHKISLRYKIGELSSNMRVGFWDSLINDAKAPGMHVVKCNSLNNLGFIYLHVLGDSLKGVKCLLKCVETADKYGYKKGMGFPLNNLAAYYRKVNNLSEALTFCYKGLRVSEELNDKAWITIFYGDIANIYMATNRPDKALKINLKCLKINEENNNNKGVVLSLIRIGSSYLALKDTSNTILYYLKCKEYSDKIGDDNMLVDINNSIGAAYGLRREFDSAFKFTNIAYQLALRTKKKPLISSTIASLAKLNYETGHNEIAKLFALEGIKIAREQHFLPQISDLAIILKRIHVKDKNYREALAWYELFVKTNDSLQSEENRKSALEKEFAYNLEKKESENKLLIQKNQIQNLQLHQNKYFLLGLLGMAILILIIGYLIFRQNKLRNEHQKMFMEQKLISSQMNPHFVFNSLNSIQQLIMSNENEKAEFYLSKFAKLIRELLESNAKESLTLKEETDILQGYLIMESKRFGKLFNYSIQVDENINQEHTNIPHMMVQPFVENAIWHGLLPKAGERNLTIKYSYDSDKTIRCTVEDNGVGREAANKKQSTFKKKSLALSFVKQRLELMQETLKVRCSVEIIDKKNEAGESLGTKIIIILPLLRL